MNTPRPVPIITDNSTFCRKKKNHHNTNNINNMDESFNAPRSPVKSAPPVSRIFRQRRGSTPGAHSVSFRKSQLLQGDVSMTSPLYKTFDQLYFDQCFTKLSQMCSQAFDEEQTITEINEENKENKPEKDWTHIMMWKSSPIRWRSRWCTSFNITVAK